MEKIQYKGEDIYYSIIRKKIKNIYISIKDGAVIVTAPKSVSKEEIEKVVYKKADWICKKVIEASLKEEKEDLYTEEEFINIVQKNVNELVRITGLRPNKVRIREIKYAWGSCSSNKNITLNSKLIKYSECVIRYVILHELCHIKHMNHSFEFWNLVGTYMPNYKEVRREFK